MKFKIRNITNPLSVMLHTSTWLPKPSSNLPRFYWNRLNNFINVIVIGVCIRWQ